jgi:hypothetical protein
MMRRQIVETTDAPGEFALGLHLHGRVAESIEAGRADDAFNYSSELVRMPYEIYMRRVFATEPLSFPILKLPTAQLGISKNHAIRPSR